MLTAYGRALRKIRIDHQVIMKNMADVLDVSTAYLSAVENGKRKIPKGWTLKIASHYCLSKEQTKELEYAEAESADEVSIRIHDVSPVKREAAIAIAKAFDSLSEEQVHKILTAVKPLGKPKE